MLHSWMLIPFIAAFAGWLFNRVAIEMLFRPHSPRKILGINVQGILPKRKKAIAGQIAGLVSSELLSVNEIAQKISQPENLAKLMPSVEEHIDRFLKVKLPEEMPVIGMFIGDKTIAQLKEVFISELEVLFPEVMGNYARQLQGELDLEKIITEKLQSIPAERMEQIIRSALAREFRAFAGLGLALGFVVGWIAVLLMLFV